MNKKFIIIGIPVLVCILALVAVLINISIRQKQGFETLLEESRRNSEQISLLDRTMQRIGDDSNEVRSLLSLEPVHYSATPSIDDSSRENDRFSILISALQSFDEHYKSIEHTNAVVKIFLNTEMRSALKSHGLSADTDGAMFNISAEKKSTSDKKPLFSGGWDGERCNLNSLVTGGRYSGSLDASSIAAFITKEMKTVISLQSTYRDFMAEFNAWAQRPQTLILLDDFKLVIEPLGSETYETRLKVRTSDYRDIGEIVLDDSGNVRFADQNWSSLTALLTEFPAVLKNIDTRSFGAIKTDEMVQALKSTFADEEFKSVLNAYGMEIAARQREDSDFIYFDITKDGNSYGSFGVLKEHGELYILDPDDVPIRSVESLDASSLFSEAQDDQKKKTRPKLIQ